MEIGLGGLATVFPLLILTIFFCRYLLVSNRNTNVPLNLPLVGMTPSLLWNLGNFYEWAVATGGNMSFMSGLFKINFHVITSSPPNLAYILKNNCANFARATPDWVFDIFGDGLYADEHQRQATDIVLNNSDFRDYRINFTQKLVQERLVPVLEEAYKKDSIIDLQDVFLRFAFDSSTCMVFGKHSGVPAASFVKAFDDVTEAWAYNLIIPSPVCKLMKCLNMMNCTETKELKNIVHESVNQMVKSRKRELANNSTAENDVGTDILSRFTKLEAEEGRSPSDKSLQSLCFRIIFASRLYLGALSWFFWLLSKHPEVEDNILMELSKVMDSDQYSHSHSIYRDEWNFDMDELKDMKYLEAVLWEALRLYPPVPISYIRAVEDEVLPDGTSVKKGSVVLCLIYGANRMESVWGEDAMEFKPERWMGREKERSDNYGYPVLGTDIIDMDFIMSMKCVAAHVLGRYHVNVDPELCVEPKLALALLVKDGLPRHVAVEGGRSMIPESRVSMIPESRVLMILYDSRE